MQIVQDFSSDFSVKSAVNKWGTYMSASAIISTGVYHSDDILTQLNMCRFSNHEWQFQSFGYLCEYCWQLRSTCYLYCTRKTWYVQFC